MDSQDAIEVLLAKGILVERCNPKEITTNQMMIFRLVRYFYLSVTKGRAPFDTITLCDAKIRAKTLLESVLFRF
ncbi:hypothetical protein RO3G_03145 [Rhizopus delemar RA 99-880]|uniref:Uncharacterized protein n=1 Tax=Rhizopus delemar (strain RA 99-880 / ATCC MYA-4621 / FGSC 9543 / NRRL 43880) TaxID=246409 RepID=I1BQG1_RHIO9|nr:hypothetical protein RO3G_03145 [Rhizopus delemar RA 99-880]|eukprot:EIE78441.1 hypothetical protein RO3G_03145 [Rhizopus delemar RA 99-880]